MYVAKNPFTLNFGKVPSLYIDRSILIDEIEECLTSEEIFEEFVLSETGFNAEAVSHLPVNMERGVNMPSIMQMTLTVKWG